MKQSLLREFVIIKPDKNTQIEKADQGLYGRLVSDYNGFKGCEMVSCHEFDKDWSSWEIHPKGEEVIILLTGNVQLVLDLENATEVIELNEQCAYAIVPSNTWHTVKTDVPSKLLFITPGEGTANKDV